MVVSRVRPGALTILKGGEIVPLKKRPTRELVCAFRWGTQSIHNLRVVEMTPLTKANEGTGVRFPVESPEHPQV